MEAFYELLRVALGHQEKLGHILSSEEWTEVFVTSQKQSVAGVAFEALEKLSSQGQKIPSELLYEWIGLSEQIKARNAVLNRHCYEVSRMIAEAGFRSCILKGQGNALLYDADDLRTPGDIDIWVEGSREDVYNFVVSKYPDVRDGDLHIDFPIFKDVPVEIHYIPGYSKVPKYEKRLQAWFMEQATEQFLHKTMLDGHEVCVPTVQFNVVQQM